MRKLNKKDKQRATQLVSEGGKTVQREMKKLRSYTVTLLLFDGNASCVDGSQPILLLQQPTAA